MKTVAFVPIRLNSQRVAGKNLRPLDGSPLMCHILKTLTEVEGIDEVYVFCSDEGIRALLIDKDRNPQWKPATLADATGAWADTFFASPWADAAHPLADLGTPLVERSLA